MTFKPGDLEAAINRCREIEKLGWGEIQRKISSSVLAKYLWFLQEVKVREESPVTHRSEVVWIRGLGNQRGKALECSWWGGHHLLLGGERKVRRRGGEGLVQHGVCPGHPERRGEASQAPPWEDPPSRSCILPLGSCRLTMIPSLRPVPAPLCQHRLPALLHCLHAPATLKHSSCLNMPGGFSPYSLLKFPTTPYSDFRTT